MAYPSTWSAPLLTGPFANSGGGSGVLGLRGLMDLLEFSPRMSSKSTTGATPHAEAFLTKEGDDSF